MARAEIKMPVDFLEKVSSLAEKTDEIIPKMLVAGGEIVESKVRSNLRSAVGNGLKSKSQSSGELVTSLGLSPANVDRDGNYNIKIGFSEPRRNQRKAKDKQSGQKITNAMLASIIEYGKSGQPPKSFLKPAMKASKNDCIETMKEVFDREVENL